MNRQTIIVDIAPGSGPVQRLKLSQGDIGRQLGVYIIQNGAALDCSGYSAHLYVLKPDKNYYEKTCSISSNLISWETAEQETPLAGECKAQIRITANGQDIGTANFIEVIEATPAAGGTPSESVIESMTQYVDAAEAAARTAVEAEEVVEDIVATYSGIPGRVTNVETRTSELESSTSALESSTNALEDGLAIVANGNTHAAITSGQFVYVRNHSTLTEGLYHATASIATNGALSTSNLAAEPSGGLNALKAKIGDVGNTDLQSQVTSLNSNFTSAITSITNRIGSKLEVKSQQGGQFAGLVQDHTMWLILAQRATVTSGGCWLVHRWGGEVVALEIIKSSSISILTNAQGTVEISYSGSSNNVIACAIRLY